MAFDYFVEDEQANLFQNPMQVRTSATTDSSGHFTVDITNAGLTHVHSAHAIIKGASTAVTDAHVVSLTTISTTTISGAAFVFTSLLGVLGLSAVASGITVYIIVEGDQA